MNDPFALPSFDEEKIDIQKARELLIEYARGNKSIFPQDPHTSINTEKMNFCFLMKQSLGISGDIFHEPQQQH